MSDNSKVSTTKKHIDDITYYYQLHSRIYDATRWSFLFGRSELIKQIPSLPTSPRILEVGCGTGKNIIQLNQRFPDAQITGVDVSPHMLQKARQKNAGASINFKKMRYGPGSLNEETYDLILLSYSMTMMGIEYSKLISELKNNLNRDGYLAVVDFHTSPFSWFKTWMEINHVDFSGDLYPRLENNFDSKRISFNRAYLGLWNYFQFIGTKN
jgi:S-adenosylmethionine-diacylgycerolhomoserine-N-methlytransferase